MSGNYHTRDDDYPPISDYGFIADCHSSALISSQGSIDWCCMPRIDSQSCFGRLLGWERGGYCRICPEGSFKVNRSYLGETLVLITSFDSESGKARLFDFFPMRRGGRTDPYHQIIRIAECLEGEVQLNVEVAPRFDYGAIQPWIKRYRKDSFMAIGGCDGLLISGDFPLVQVDRHMLAAQSPIRVGERLRLSLLYCLPEELDFEKVKAPDSDELDRRLKQTIAWWQSWVKKETNPGPFPELVRRSALVLKGLSFAQTGAIAAAATTSLPEAWGGERNWDYRFTWIRDSVFTVRSLAEIGFLNEADDFRRFIERSAAGSPSELQIMFGMGGERRLEEYDVESLGGYRGAKPVRIGNAASRQVQLDMYGELLDLAWRWHLGGRSPDNDYWEFLVNLVAEVERNWRKPDHGIWEFRGRSHNFVFSKVMCWSAVDKGIALAQELRCNAPLDEWRKLREEIREEVENRGYDRQRGVFVQYFGGQEMDAALLRMPMTGFLDYKDPRMVRTVDAIMSELMEGGLLRRYAPGIDGLSGREGVFIACSFWLAECLARQNRMSKAREVFETATATANELGLFSEQYDPKRREMLGNFPQALTHLSLISAAMTIKEVDNSV